VELPEMPDVTAVNDRAEARSVIIDGGGGQARVAAVGDVHLNTQRAGQLRPRLEFLPEAADVLLLAGDLTVYGTVAEARVAAAEFAGLGLPVVAILGNHDYHSGRETEIASILTDSGITVLDGSGTVLTLGGPGPCAGPRAGLRLGITWVKGFGTGFPARCAAEFGEPETKAFVGYSKAQAAALGRALADLDADVRIALTHFAPVPETLAGEPPEIYPFLGSYFLAEAADAAGADLFVHGHAHSGTERGLTPGGIPVRNVALPVLRRPCAIYGVAARARVADIPTP
jgi:Icc-related predicted phosphoesterase